MDWHSDGKDLQVVNCLALAILIRLKRAIASEIQALEKGMIVCYVYAFSVGVL